MNIRTRNLFACLAVAVLGLMSAVTLAQEAPAPTTPQVERPDGATPDVEAAPTVEAPDDAAPAADEPEMTWTQNRGRWRGRSSRSNDGIVTVGGSSYLAEGQRTDAVVSVFGSSTSLGEVRDAVVSVFGDTRVESGRVGDTAVSVFGNNYVNTVVGGSVVAVLGNIELGPNADVRDNVVVIGGTITRAPGAQVRGGVQHVLAIPASAATGLRAWFENCMRYLRPLSLAPGLGWAWAIALGCLALYAVIAILLREPLDRCVKTLQDAPGLTIVASLLVTVLTPVLLVILCITFIGIAFIPVVGFGIILATLFGKAVVLAWMGRGVVRLFDTEDKLPSVVAVLVGGVIVLALYLVPVLGFLIYNLLGMLALGVVVVTLLAAAKERRRNAPPPPFAAGPRPAMAGGPSPMHGGPVPMAASYAAAGPAGPTSTADVGATGGIGAGGTPNPSAGPTFGTAESASSATEGGASAASPGVPPGVDSTAQAGATAGGSGGFANPPGGGMGYTAPPPGAIDAASLPRAGFWIRMLALLVDTILIGVALNILTHVGEMFLVVIATYGAIMWKMKGTTVGGIVCNLKVIRTDGQPIDWSTAIVRALGCFLSLIVVGLGFIWIAFDPGRQSWHDKIAGTAVVRVPQGVSLL
jgi:uncharacterized RDD family membrane protein YckC